MRTGAPAANDRRSGLIGLVIFSAAFGFVEAAVVTYLRALGHFTTAYDWAGYHTYLNLGVIRFVSPLRPIAWSHRIADIEVAREAATLFLLVGVALAASKTWRGRAGAFLVGFAGWDLTYYLFLKILDHWPPSLLTTDVFFLIPVATIGPVLTPLVLFAAVFVVGARLYLTSTE